jgi:hypothetical protein
MSDLFNVRTMVPSSSVGVTEVIKLFCWFPEVTIGLPYQLFPLFTKILLVMVVLESCLKPPPVLIIVPVFP